MLGYHRDDRARKGLQKHAFVLSFELGMPGGISAEELKQCGRGVYAVRRKEPNAVGEICNPGPLTNSGGGNFTRPNYRMPKTIYMCHVLVWKILTKIELIGYFPI